MAGPIAAGDAGDQNSRVDTPQGGNRMSDVPPREGGTFHFGTFANGYQSIIFRLSTIQGPVVIKVLYLDIVLVGFKMTLKLSFGVLKEKPYDISIEIP